MPGLSGLFLRNDADIEIASNLQHMLDKQLYRPQLKVEKWTAPPFAAGRVHLGVYDTGEIPISVDHYVFWFDGEIYNHTELMSLYGLKEETWKHKKDAQFIFDLYQRIGEWTFLTELDGIFSMALFDKKEKAVSIISDRLGLRPLHYWISPHLFAFSAEVKSLLALPEFSKEIDRLALEEFLAYGYMLNDRTWFEDAKVLDPATVLTVTQSKESQSHYWSWNDIESISASSISVVEAAEEMGRLFQIAVEKRVSDDHSYSITLSGGLDSRAILAAMPPHKLPVPCLTFGRKRCGDIRFASLAAKKRNCPHYIVPVDGQNDWLQQQEWVVWATDGLASMLSLMGRYMSPILGTFSDVMLNGYVGDTMIQGTYGASLEETSMRKKFSLTPTGFDAIAHMLKIWKKSGLQAEHFFEFQRARRYILMGSIQHSAYIEQRKPFVDKDFVNFAMGLPKEYRCSGEVAVLMLLTRYPDLFRYIPYEQTGFSIRTRRIYQEVGSFVRRAKRRIGIILPGNLKFVPQYESLAYLTWLKQPPAKSFIIENLYSSNCYLSHYLDLEKIKQICESYFSGKSTGYRLIGHLLTLEIYLKLVFDGRIPTLPTIPKHILVDNRL